MKSLWRLVVCGIWLWVSAPASEAQIVPETGTGTGVVPDAASLPSPTTTITRPEAIPDIPAIPGPVDPQLYRVGPGDVLQLQLWGRVSRNWRLQVGPEGTITLPGAGTLQVSDRSLAQVRTEVLAKVRNQFPGANMDLRLMRPRQFVIYLTGQVKSPGPNVAASTQRVGDVINRGSVTDNASMRHIEVRHTDGTREVADIDLFLRTGASRLNPLLRDGDVLYVPVATDFIYASGALARPGRFELGPDDSLLTLFQLAGDPIPAADITRALLLRWKDPFTPETLSVRLDEVYSRQNSPKLREGDRVYVYYLPQYHLQHEAFVIGEVARPGSFPIVEGRHRLSDLIAWAGGFLPTSDLSAIRVHRRNPAASDRDPELERLLRLSRDQLTSSEYEALRTKLAALREDYSVDWHRLQRAPQDLDLLLRDGDVVRVDRLVNSIRIDGEIRRPGILSFRPGLSIVDYVKQAGGFTNQAWPSRIRVTRAVTGQTLPARSISTLDPGDFVWVPEKPDRSFWDHTRETLTAVAQVATVVIAIRSVK